MVKDKDGKYHWYYEFKLMKNPTILFLLWKLFFWIFVGIWAFTCIIELCEGHFSFSDFSRLSKVFLLIVVGFEVLAAIGYFIYAAFMGFKYCVLFDMDENGVKHTQLPRQFKKAQAAALVSALAGIAAGSPGLVGSSLLAATKSSLSSSWSAVKSVEIFRKRNVIKVNERLIKNQVYVEPEDFQFVEDFIRSHVDKNCKVYEK